MLTNSIAIALHAVEGFALAMMCQYRTQSRKISINILKEVVAVQRIFLQEFLNKKTKFAANIYIYIYIVNL